MNRNTCMARASVNGGREAATANGFAMSSAANRTPPCPASVAASPAHRASAAPGASAGIRSWLLPTAAAAGLRAARADAAPLRVAAPLALVAPVIRSVLNSDGRSRDSAASAVGAGCTGRDASGASARPLGNASRLGAPVESAPGAASVGLALADAAHEEALDFGGTTGLPSSKKASMSTSRVRKEPSIPPAHRTRHAQPLPTASTSVPCTNAIFRAGQSWHFLASALWRRCHVVRVRSESSRCAMGGWQLQVHNSVCDHHRTILPGLTCWPTNGSSHGYRCPSSHSQASCTLAPGQHRTWKSLQVRLATRHSQQ